MLLNRLLSLTVLLSVAGSVFAAPLPRPFESEVSGVGEAELEKEHDGWEFELETKPVPTELEVEGSDPTASSKHTRLAIRSHVNRSLASSVLDAQKQLDVISPQIDQAMQGPLGSIEKEVGEHLVSVHEVMQDLDTDMKQFIGDEDKVLYMNPEGTGQLTEDEMAKLISKCLLSISDIEETVKHVSGFKVTSAQLDIKNDLLSMKNTLSTLMPGVRSAVANMMAMALSLGSGAAGVKA
ncbi:hypothetical protein FRC07_001055 [Ceratobasidium sp. 392]|nr:hypothetical protein FRC07_001055 [Ceratobasidium sp. 392]